MIHFGLILYLTCFKSSQFLYWSESWEDSLRTQLFTKLVYLALNKKKSKITSSCAHSRWALTVNTRFYCDFWEYFKVFVYATLAFLGLKSRFILRWLVGFYYLASRYTFCQSYCLHSFNISSQIVFVNWKQHSTQVCIDCDVFFFLTAYHNRY